MPYYIKYSGYNKFTRLRILSYSSYASKPSNEGGESRYELTLINVGIQFMLSNSSKEMWWADVVANI